MKRLATHRLLGLAAPGLPAAAPTACWLRYRTPGTTAEFCLQAYPLAIRQHAGVDFVVLSNGCELRLDWVVAINGMSQAA